MDNQSLRLLFETYLTVEKRSSPHTIVSYKTDLNQFIHYLSTLMPPKAVSDATAQDLRGWIMLLAKERFNPRSINRKMAAIRAFYVFLQRRALVVSSPMDQLKSLKCKQNLPVFIQEKELLSFLDKHAFEATFSGLRDKLILELLYGTGIRLAELLTLRTTAINLTNETLKVIGKRNKERILPFPRPLKWLIETYLSKKEQLGYGATILMVTDYGKPCYPMFIYRVVKKYLTPTTRSSRHSPHILRHTFATHLLDKGADLQAIKELLGHANLAATQIYTHNSLTKLKEIFKKAHPRAEEET